MAIILILTILILTSIYILISKNIKNLPTISLGATGVIATYFFITSLRTQNIDAFYYGMMAFFLSVSLLIVWSSYTLIDYDIEEKRYPLYYAMALILISSLCAIVYFDNLIAVYVAIEVSAFLSAGMVMIKPSSINFRAGIKYLFLSILASVFFLIGMVIIYRMTNSFNISELEGILQLNYNFELKRYDRQIAPSQELIVDFYDCLASLTTF